MEWRKKRGARGLLGHLRGYGCQIQFIRTEEELIVLACEIFGVENCGDSASVDEAIVAMKSRNKSGTRRRAYANIERLWPVLEAFWLETQYLTDIRAKSSLWSKGMNVALDTTQ
jgi:hypothetical protein